MNPSQWQEAKELIAQALEQPSADREAFVAARCTDPTLRNLVATLLRHAPASLSGSPPYDSPESDIVPGTHVGPYVIVGRLGEGGMGRVFLGTDPRLHRMVALKCLIAARMPNANLRARILREARAAARINHANVAIVHDVVESDERAFIVMEYVEGESLAARLRRGKLPVNTVVEIGCQVAAGLVAAHEKNVVHRDLKPANIQIRPNGSAKILDFGVAKAPAESVVVGTSTSTTAAGEEPSRIGQPGTPAYMAPEQLLGLAADERSDVYSLGVVLFEMACGHRPYKATDPIELTAEVSSSEAPRVDDLDPSFPRVLGDVIASALKRDVEHRCPSARDLLTALESAGAKLYSKDAPARMTGSVAARKWWSWAGGAIAVVFLLVAAGLNLTPRVRWDTKPAPPVSPVVAVLPFSTFSHEATTPALAAGLADVLVGSLGVLPGVVTISRTSTLPYADTTDLVGAAKTLGATILVVGSLQQEATSIRATISLIRPGQAAALYSKTFDGSTTRIFQLQGEISEAIADQFARLQFVDAGTLVGLRPRLSRPPTSSVAAFEEYAQGRVFIERPDVPGGIDRAIALFERAISRDPRFALAHAGLGEALWMKYGTSHDRTLPDRARTAMLEALRLAPTEPRVRYALAVMYRGSGRLDEAIEELQRALSLGGASDDAHRLLGRTLAERDRTEEAIAELRKAIELRPGFWDSYRALGLVYYRMGNYEAAAEAFSRITELQPDNAWGFQTLGTVYQAQGKNALALANYDRANSLAPSATSYSNVGTLLYSEKRFADAVRAYESSLKLRPNEPAVVRNLADALMKLNERDRAVAAYQKAINLASARLEVNPQDARSLALRGHCEAKLGRMAEARRFVQQARALDPTDGDVAYQQAVVEALGGASLRALEALDEAVRLGYSRVMARDDDDLTSLHASPRFKAIVAPNER